MGVDPDRNTKSSGQAKVCQFDDALVVDQQVLWFQVPVKDTVTVAEVYSLQDLVEVALKTYTQMLETERRTTNLDRGV